MCQRPIGPDPGCVRQLQAEHRRDHVAREAAAVEALVGRVAAAAVAHVEEVQCRQHQFARHVVDSGAVGRITSGSYSPTLDTSIAMGYVLVRHAAVGQVVDIDIRGRTAPAKIVPLPFYSRTRPINNQI